MDYSEIRLSDDRTHHLLNGKPLYLKRFIHVESFHAPGLAPVVDKSGAYHIDTQAKQAYKDRFDLTFGFYQGVAAVCKGQWFHIFPNGTPVYDQRYAWCGNFQEGACTVRDFNDNYFHIDLNGRRMYADNYRYAGDFKYGIGVVQGADGLHTHIRLDGSLLHGRRFVDLDVYHKGFARAKDKKGWHHIRLDGSPAYSMRYQMVEPFYNGFARVETFDGRLLIIDESGEVVLSLGCE